MGMGYGIYRAELQKVFDTDVCANAIWGIFLCSYERLKFKVHLSTYTVVKLMVADETPAVAHE